MARRLHPSTPRAALGASFVYAGGTLKADDTKVVAELTDGVVLRKERGLQVARTLRRHHKYEGSLLWDPSKYEDVWMPGRSAAHHAFERQASLDVSHYLSPSPFLEKGNVGSLRQTLELGQEFSSIVQEHRPGVPSLTVLPLTKHWLSHGLDALMTSLREAEGRFAVVLGDRTDPLNSKRAVGGFRELLSLGSVSALLRSDVAGIAALAHGVELVAIGTGTSVRHFVPPGMTGGGRSDDPTPSVLVRCLADYKKGSKLELAHGADRGLLECGCAVCDGRTLARFGDDRYWPEARRHNAEVAFSMSQHITNFRLDLRKSTWSLICSEAIETHEELERRSGIPFVPSGQLRAWANL